MALLALGQYDFATLWQRLVASLFYVHTLIYGEHPLVNKVAWSLEVEVQFYVLMPLLARLLTKSGRSRLGVLGALIALF